MIVADFADSYGIRLYEVGNSLSWAEFYTLLRGLFARPDTRLAIAHQPDPETPATERNIDREEP